MIINGNLFLLISLRVGNWGQGVAVFSGRTGRNPVRMDIVHPDRTDGRPGMGVLLQLNDKVDR